MPLVSTQGQGRVLVGGKTAAGAAYTLISVFPQAGTKKGASWIFRGKIDLPAALIPSWAPRAFPLRKLMKKPGEAVLLAFCAVQNQNQDS